MNNGNIINILKTVIFLRERFCNRYIKANVIRKCSQNDTSVHRTIQVFTERYNVILNSTWN